MAVACPVCGYEAQGNDQIMGHLKQMTDDPHKDALKQKLGSKGGEASDAAKDKAGDAVSGIKDKISS